jgi:hypothetical protein
MKDGYLDDEFHFAQMVSLMGPPPKEFLERSEQCSKYWDAEGKGFLSHVRKYNCLQLLTDKGNWIGTTPIPEQTLETREMRLKGKDRVMLLALMRKLLKWLPEERPSAQDLFEDEFLLLYDVSERDPEDDGLREST